MSQHFRVPLGLWLLLSGLWLAAGCSPEEPETRSRATAPPLVDIAIAATQAEAANAPSYIGATEPVQTVTLRSRVEGQLLSLLADVGDPVQRGAVLAQLDRDVLRAELEAAEAELAARQSDVEQAQALLAESRAQVAQAQAELRQARADSERLTGLAEEGAIASQDAELARTNLSTREQLLQSAREQVRTRERAIASAERRVSVQEAIAAQASKRLDFATLEAPLTGTVLRRVVDPGNLVQPGQELLEIGDLSALHVSIQVSDRDLSQFVLGAPVRASLDAFPGETFRGEVTRISPVADAAARLIPVEVTLPNPGEKVGSGLVARVTVASDEFAALTIPQSALSLAEGDRAVVFVPQDATAETPVAARTVRVGNAENGRVEILSGLQPGEAFVVNSDRPLEAGQVVRRSFFSE